MTESESSARKPIRNECSDQRTRERQRRDQAYVADICDHLQAAMFYLGNDQPGLARRSLRIVGTRYNQMVEKKTYRPRQLDLVWAAASSWITTPDSWRTLVDLCHATTCLVEWQYTRFAETLIAEQQARYARHGRYPL